MGVKAKFPRTCRFCGENRPEMMTRNKYCPGGLSTICKPCGVKQQTAYQKSESGKYLRSLPRVKAQRAAASRRYAEKKLKPEIRKRQAAMAREKAAFEAKYPGYTWAKRLKPLECIQCGENDVTKLAIDEERKHRRLCRECASGLQRMRKARAERRKEK